MTNGDKYLKDGVDVEEFVSKFEEYYDTKAENYIGTKIDFLKAFLREAVKPSLSEDEKVILRNAHSPNGTIAYYVGRDKDTKNLFMRTKYDIYQYDWGCFDTLFQFIQPRRRI